MMLAIKDGSIHCKVPCVTSTGMRVIQDQGVSLQHINNRKSWRGMQPGSFLCSRVGNSTESTHF